ncbi:MAG: histidine kinase dimerization/phospho-acceptor domain-containing protein [Candidatus Muiribacteriota bacterium]|jgi:signal transduction histidine kinase
MDKKDISEITIENLSHIVKTPLSIILGYTEILLAGIAGKMNDEQEEYIKKIKNEVLNTDNYLNIFIDNIEKEFSNINSKIKELNLTEILKDVFLIFYSKCENGKKCLDFILPEKDYFYKLHEDFKKAVILIIQDMMKKMGEENKIKLKFSPGDSAGFMIEIYTEAGCIEDFFNTDSIMIITAKKVLNLSGISVFIKDKKVNIKYE